jgi:hypothetical protein
VSVTQLEISIGGTKQDVGRILERLLEDSPRSVGSSKEIPGPALLTVKEPDRTTVHFVVPELVTIAVSFGGSVAASLVAAYIYNALKVKKGKRVMTTINRRVIRVTKSGLTEIIEETIKREEN